MLDKIDDTSCAHWPGTGSWLAAGSQTNPFWRSGHLGLAMVDDVSEVSDIGKGLFVAAVAEFASFGLNPTGPLIKEYKTFFILSRQNGCN